MENARKRLVDSLEELGRLYDFLNEEFFESALSRPIITIMPEECRGRGTRVLGWFTKYKVWSEKSGERAYELNVTADYANRPMHDIATTLLHEMVHQYARENNINDCSRAGTYHNKHFKQIASKHGLAVNKTERFGFSHTTLTHEAINIVNRFKFGGDLIYRPRWLAEEDMLDLIGKCVPENTPDREAVVQDMFNGIHAGKLKITKDGIKPKKSSTRKYICPKCGMSVRATRVVNIKCGDCDLVMHSAVVNIARGD